MHSIVTASDVAFELSNGRELFRNLGFSLSTGLTALVGPNGVGKTTLARLLAGELEPSLGRIRHEKPVTFLPQRESPEIKSVEAYLVDWEWSALGERLLDGIDRTSLCTTLSGGEWMRVRLVHALNDQYLILDEPTNDLDRAGREALLEFLRKREGGTLLISHDRECLALCDEVLELSNRGLSKYGGGWSAYADQRAAERNRLRTELDRAKRERDHAISERNEQRARQEKRNRRGAATAARGGIPKILLGARKRRAQATTGKVDTTTLARANQKVREIHTALAQVKIDPIMYADLVGQALPTSRLVAKATAFNVRFADWIYAEDLNFRWRGNVRVALRGENGSGKSTLLKAVLGSPLEIRGDLRRGGLSSLYVDQKCAALDDEKSIYENVRDAAALDESEIRNGLARFLFHKEAVFQKVRDLSGGERLRATLARGFLAQQKPELLVLDEPTNNLDIQNIEFLEDLVSQFRGALLVISHDEKFLERCGITEELPVTKKK